MYKKSFITAILPILILVGALFYFFKDDFRRIEEDEIGENEERPKQEMPPAEKALFEEYLQSRREQSGEQARVSGGSVYANGKILGSWSPKVTLTGWNGYRVDNSTYDSLNDVFYVESFAGHLYKMQYKPEVKWTLLNHQDIMRRSVFTGIHLPDNSFRLIRSNAGANRMEYSDDEGRSWQSATGASVVSSSSNKAVVVNESGVMRIILMTYAGGYQNIYFSDDHGASYIASKYKISTGGDDARLAKAEGKNEVYFWSWNNAGNSVETYKYNTRIRDFELVRKSTSVVDVSRLHNAYASYYNGKYHFYLITHNGSYNIYYSGDEGTTWSLKNASHDRDIETFLPNNPNVLFTGFEDMRVSTNGGTTWTGFGWKLGWDLQHMGTYPMKGGQKYITLAGLDFGCYVSETPENKDSYTWCNNGAWFAMHYDAASNERYNSVYLGNQDRGTTAYADTGDTVSTIDVDGTDVLRVAYANRGKSIWSWFYYGRIRHRFNFATSQGETAIYDGLGNWWAAPIIASPNPDEDAIYGAWGSNLQIFKYDAISNSILRLSHPFNFESTYGDVLGGFGYSELDRNLWYAALNNGTFLYSKDAGKTWGRAIPTGSTPRANDQSYNYTKNQIVIQASRLDSAKVFYAGVGNLFMVSDNGGRTFSRKTNGLNIYRMRDFVLSPDEKFVFAACGSAGAWVYDAEGDKWYQMQDAPVPSVDFTDVEYIEGSNIVRFATYGSGVMDLKLNTSFGTLASPGQLTTSVPYGKSVEIKWNYEGTGHDGFIVERAGEGDFTVIDTVYGNHTYYQDESAQYGVTYLYQLRAFKQKEISSHSPIVKVKVPEQAHVSKGLWKVMDYSSQEVRGEYSPARYAIDENPSTIWHSQYSGINPTLPQHIIIDLGQPVVVSAFGYLPRQDGMTNGTINEFEFYISDDTSSWGAAVAKGNFAQGTGKKEVLLNTISSGRYIKLVALSEQEKRSYVSLAEIDLIYKFVSPPNNPVNLQAILKKDFEVELTWQKNSEYDFGYYVEQKIDGEYERIVQLNSDETSLVLRGLSIDSVYHFRVKSFNNSGVSDPSNEVEIRVEKLITSSNELISWKVFPNPTDGEINLDLPKGFETYSLSVIDLNGRLMLKQHHLNTPHYKFSISNFPSGQYILVIDNGFKKLTRRIQKL